MPDEISFSSHGTRLAAWYLTGSGDDLASASGRPCVVMGHGFGATKDAGLLPFAEQFAAAGCDVLIFDYRGFGLSDGHPRQHVSHRRHRDDYRAAVASARARSGVDPDRIVLWGSSYSGGHVIPVAAGDGRIAAVVSQGAAMDGRAALLEILRYAGAGQLLKVTAHGLLDAAGSLLRRRPHLMPIVGPPGSLATITAPDAETGYRVIMGPTFRNEMCARGVLTIALNRPVASADKVRCPVLLIIAEDDNIAPVSAVRAVAAKTGAEVQSYPCGHFDIYTGAIFDKSVAAQVDFLRRTLSVATA